jgi:hypothetical protein
MASKAHDSFPDNSILVQDCHQCPAKPAECNRAQLVWMPEHVGIDGKCSVLESRQLEVKLNQHFTGSLYM